MKLVHALVLAASLAVPRLASTQAPDIAAAARLQAEARTRALVEGARREGEVMVYHSTQTEDLKPVFDAFTARYGVKVRNWRSSSENVVQRVVSESRAGKPAIGTAEPRVAHAKLRSFEGIVPKGTDWRTLGAAAEEPQAATA